MKKMLWLIIPLVAFFGCGKNGAEGIDEDETAIESLIGASDYLNYTEHYGEEDTTGTKEEIAPIFWWRGKPYKVDRNIDIEIVGDSAFVEINVVIYDSLHIIALDSIIDDSVYITRHLLKPFTDHAKRYAIFKKDTSADYHRGWRLYALSGVDIESEPNTIQIDSLKIEWGDSVRVITDILKLQMRGEVLAFEPWQDVTLSVYTNDTTGLVFFHTWRAGRPRRWRARYECDYFHGHCYAAPGGIHHIAVDVMTDSTLCDSEAPYDANTWIIVYRVVE